jgi:hypothetical protein
MERAFEAVARDDRRVRWPVEAHGCTSLRYPLSVPPPSALEEAYYDVELWLADEYVYVTSEAIEPFDDTECACGASLDADGPSDTLFYAERLRVRCSACGAPHDVSKRVAVWRHPDTRESRSIDGGATFRFALVVDCGKCWPRPADFGVHPDLKALCEASFGQPFYDVLDVY